MRIALVLSAIMFLVYVKSDALDAADDINSPKLVTAQEESMDYTGPLDQFSDDELQHMIEGVTSRGAYGPPNISGSMSSVVKSVNELSYSHQEIEVTSMPATHSIESLRQGLLHLRESIDSLELSFTRKVNASQKNKTNAGYITYAYKGQRQYIESSFELPDGAKANDDIFVFNGKDSFMFSKLQLTGSRTQTRASTTTREARDYLERIPVFSGPDAAGHDPMDDLAAYPLIFKRVFEISPKLEMVDGYPCHVISSPLGMVMWIHADGNSCYLLRLLEFRMVGEHNTLVLNRIIANRDFRHINNELLWPFVTVESYFEDTSSDSTLHQGWSRTREFTVSNVEINSVNDSRFEFEFPPGTKVIDSIRKVYYLVPEGSEKLDEAIANGARILPDGTIPDGIRIGNVVATKPILGNARKIGIWFLWIVNALFFLFIIFYFIRKRRLNVK
ncbi:hypothetical protein [Gimesia panareensis]|uniref:hypothetical protein n=1 Tax=Gimesia panareensis TaxID=2527978 RepID=UPI00118C5988|nr:hypothetical protein [Gimesia panareensis]QDU50781.1 hypothetical protein Pan110_31410 [Gimesia panareensis]